MFFFLEIYLYIIAYVYIICICICFAVAKEEEVMPSRTGVQLHMIDCKSPGTVVTDGCELLCGFWAQNPGPLAE